MPKNKDFYAEYERTKRDYYGETHYHIPSLEAPPKAVQLIHLELISRYKKMHDFDMKSLLV